MKTNQRGAAVTILIIIIFILIAAAGVYAYSNNKVATNAVQTVTQPNQIPTEAATSQTAATKTVTTTQVTVTTPTKLQAEVVSEDEIINATYTLTAEFDAKRKFTHNIVFPPKSPTNDNLKMLTGIASITQNGTLSYDQKNPQGEMFWITNSTYSDNTKTAAIVNIGATFGASGQDNRTFLVTKAGGKVSTLETTKR